MMTDSMDGVNPDLYDSGEDKSTDKPDSVDEQESMDTPSLVDIKTLTGKDGVKPKEGEERVVKVVAIHGDQAEIVYAPEKPDEEEGETKPDMEPDEELQSMNKEY